jgi:folate-binding protein YgfZ
MIQARTAAGYDAARRRAGLIERSDRGRIVVSGRDRAAYLQGLLTNDIAALGAGAGCYAAYLTAQGRLIADLHVYELGDVLLLVVPGSVKNTVLAKLDQFIFSEDVALGDVTATFGQLAAVGPQAAALVARTLDGLAVDDLSAMAPHANARASWRNDPVIVARVTDTGEPGFDLFIGRERLDGLRDALRGGGAVDVDEAAADTLRIEAGVPLFHRDMDAETIPLEAGLEATAISFTKGCYVGQEVVIRVLHRGHGRVARKLVGLTLDGAQVPGAAAAIQAAGRDVGQVTSAAWSPSLDRAIALGYVQRAFVEPGTVVTVAGTPARVTALPFVGRRTPAGA